jgi:hypothetical protein
VLRFDVLSYFHTRRRMSVYCKTAPWWLTMLCIPLFVLAIISCPCIAVDVPTYDGNANYFAVAIVRNNESTLLLQNMERLIFFASFNFQMKLRLE